MALSNTNKEKLNNMCMAAGKAGLGTIVQTLGKGIFEVATHSYGTAHDDWTLSSTENDAVILTATGTADAAVAAIASPTKGKVLIVSNATGQALTVKAAEQTGVVVANTKTAILMGNGTDFARVTADA